MAEEPAPQKNLSVGHAPFESGVTTGLK